MLKKLGALFFYFVIIIAALGLANFLSITFYQKPLPDVIKDLLFVLTRK
jgi:hypothetical protein